MYKILGLNKLFILIRRILSLSFKRQWIAKSLRLQLSPPFVNVFDTNWNVAIVPEDLNSPVKYSPVSPFKDVAFMEMSKT